MSTLVTRVEPGRRAAAVRLRRTPVPLLAFAGYLVLGLALTARLWVNPAQRMIAGNPDDVTLYTWFLTWDVHALGTGQSPLVTHALNAPVGVNAMWNTSLLLPALLFDWLTRAAGALVVYNVLTLLAPVLSAWCAFLVFRALRVRAPAAFLGGLVFGFSPAVVHSLIGHVTVAFAALIPVLVYLVLDAVGVVGERPAWRSGLWLGLLSVAQLFIGEELLLCAVLASVTVLLVLAASRPREVLRHLSRAAVAGGVALGVVGLLAGYPLFVQFFGPLRQHGSAFTIDFFTADLTGFVTPSRLMLLHTAHSAAVADAFRGRPPEYLAYLGWPLIVVAVIAAVLLRRDLRVRVAAVGAAVFAVLSLGGTLHIHNEDTGITLPWSWLRRLPVVDAALATRLALLVALFAALLLAVTVDTVAGSSRRLEPSAALPAVPRPRDAAPLRRAAVRPAQARVLGAVAVAVVCVLPVIPRPLPVSTTAPVPPYFTTQARSLPAGTRLLVLPYATGTVTAPMRWQAAAGMSFAMPGGYFTGPAWDGHAYIGGDVPRPTARLLIETGQTDAVPALTDQQRADAAQDFAYWGVDAVVLGPCPHQGALRQLMVQLLDTAPDYVGGVLIWNLHPQFPQPGG